MDTSKVASNILSRGVKLDMEKRYTEALVCYQEGIELLFEMAKHESGEKGSYLKEKVREYMTRAEKLKVIVANLKKSGKYHEQIRIKNDDTGYSYESLFSEYLNSEVRKVQIEDPYIKAHHQVQNLVRFCELLVSKCKNLKEIKLLTKKDDTEQTKGFELLKTDLANHNVVFIVDYSDSLHDRQIELSNGWVLKIGRGLDMFKPPVSKFSLGIFNLKFRKCHETTVDIYQTIK
ncbi:PREDICTED: MIT domain-containing protein 1-like isoform X1 [Nicrophorus vespilloides]|uniref:MIT domain-containing protein 1-like isoform X1 n=1 Tax=Nicrophorus vespilloides TaxID=110193 RepID=A0ABM1N9X4_NICVS|nr:PREDICTED: MIT domain-containing protein 1-like isoform X1 [Nicrophorus vespilloides]